MSRSATNTALGGDGGVLRSMSGSLNIWGLGAKPSTRTCLIASRSCVLHGRAGDV